MLFLRVWTHWWPEGIEQGDPLGPAQGSGHPSDHATRKYCCVRAPPSRDEPRVVTAQSRPAAGVGAPAGPRALGLHNDGARLERRRGPSHNPRYPAALTWLRSNLPRAGGRAEGGVHYARPKSAAAREIVPQNHYIFVRRVAPTNFPLATSTLHFHLARNKHPAKLTFP